MPSRSRRSSAALHPPIAGNREDSRSKPDGRLPSGSLSFFNRSTDRLQRTTWIVAHSSRRRCGQTRKDKGRSVPAVFEASQAFRSPPSLYTSHNYNITMHDFGHDDLAGWEPFPTDPSSAPAPLDPTSPGTAPSAYRLGWPTLVPPSVRSAVRTGRLPIGKPTPPPLMGIFGPQGLSHWVKQGHWPLRSRRDGGGIPPWCDAPGGPGQWPGPSSSCGRRRSLFPHAAHALPFELMARQSLLHFGSYE